MSFFHELRDVKKVATATRVTQIYSAAKEAGELTPESIERSLKAVREGDERFEIISGLVAALEVLDAEAFAFIMEKIEPRVVREAMFNTKEDYICLQCVRVYKLLLEPGRTRQAEILFAKLGMAYGSFDSFLSSKVARVGYQEKNNLNILIELGYPLNLLIEHAGPKGISPLVNTCFSSYGSGFTIMEEFARRREEGYKIFEHALPDMLYFRFGAPKGYTNYEVIRQKLTRAGRADEAQFMILMLMYGYLVTRRKGSASSTSTDLNARSDHFCKLLAALLAEHEKAGPKKTNSEIIAENPWNRKKGWLSNEYSDLYKFLTMAVGAADASFTVAVQKFLKYLQARDVADNKSVYYEVDVLSPIMKAVNAHLLAAPSHAAGDAVRAPAPRAERAAAGGGAGAAAAGAGALDPAEGAAADAEVVAKFIAAAPPAAVLSASAPPALGDPKAPVYSEVREDSESNQEAFRELVKALQEGALRLPDLPIGDAPNVAPPAPKAAASASSLPLSDAALALAARLPRAPTGAVLFGAAPAPASGARETRVAAPAS